MNALTNLFGARKNKHSYRLHNDQLVVVAKTLDQAYAAQRQITTADAMYRNAINAPGLAAQDGQPNDIDDRDGHVILPKERFEAHDGIAAFGVWPHDGLNRQDVIENTSGATKVTRAADAFVYGRDIEAVAVLDGDSFTMTTDVKKIKKARYGRESKEVFELSADGKATAGKPESLKDYETGQSKQRTIDRINNLISAASIWRAQGESLDGKDRDLNPLTGETVAFLTRDSLGPILSNEKVLSQITYGSADGHSPHRLAENFNIEVTPDHFEVHGGQSRLTGNFEGDSIHVRLEDRNNAESISISNENGTITYQTYGLR